jgi:hypothetical protein
MKRLAFVLVLSTAFVSLALPRVARACPNCQEAISDAADGDDDPQRESRAYNQSIYLMAFMPYLLLSGLGFMMYRGAKAADRRARLQIPAIEVPGSNEESA